MIYNELMNDIIFFINKLKNNIISSYCTENNIEAKFSLEKKIYYFLIRPLLPVYLRRLVQQSFNKNVDYNRDFIWSEFVDYIRDNISPDYFNKNLYPDNTETAIILTHDVETQHGFDFIPKILELEKKNNFKSSWNIVPEKYKISDDIIKMIKNNECEIGIHGYNHDGKLYFSKKIFDKRARYINEALEKYEAVGFRSPMTHRNMELLQQLNIKYDSSFFDYDPFQPFPGGTGCIWPYMAGKFVELPYTLPQDHVLFIVLKQKNIDIWKNKIEFILKNKGMILALTHPDYLMLNDNLKLYEELLFHLSEIKKACHLLPKDMADWCIQNTFY